MNKKTWFSILALLAVFTAGFAYYASVYSTHSDTTAHNEIVTSFYPLYFFTERITRDTDVTAVNLAGARDPHDYEPTRADMERMLNAQLVILQGAQLEAWAEDTEARLEVAEVPVLVVAEHLTLRSITDNDTEHTEEEEHETDEHEHAHGTYDPHTWFDPVLAQDMVAVITEELVQLFPDQRTTLETNASTLTDELANLHETYTARLATCVVNEAFVSHDAIGYLANRYGLQLHAISGISTEDEPSAQLLAELAKESDGARAILVEEGTPSAYADTLARETGLTSLPFNPLGRGTLNPELDYFAVMLANLDSLATAFGCETE